MGKNDYGQLGNPAAGAGVAAAVEMVPRWGSTVNVTVRAGAFHTVVLAGVWLGGKAACLGEGSLLPVLMCEVGYRSLVVLWVFLSPQNIEPPVGS